MAAEWREQIAQINRFEVIDETGRAYVVRPCRIECSFQDDDRTLKVFVTRLALPPRAQEEDHVEAVDSRERDLAADSGVRGVELPPVTERPCPPPLDLGPIEALLRAADSEHNERDKSTFGDACPRCQARLRLGDMRGHIELLLAEVHRLRDSVTRPEEQQQAVREAYLDGLCEAPCQHPWE
jgi:hypothetical protein